MQAVVKANNVLFSLKSKVTCFPSLLPGPSLDRVKPGVHV